MFSEIPGKARNRYSHKTSEVLKSRVIARHRLSGVIGSFRCTDGPISSVSPCLRGEVTDEVAPAHSVAIRDHARSRAITRDFLPSNLGYADVRISTGTTAIAIAPCTFSTISILP